MSRDLQITPRDDADQIVSHAFMCVAIVGLSRCRPAAECHGSAQWHAATLCICAYGTSSHVPGCGSERRRRQHYLHPALSHTQPQVVASSKPLPFENTTNFTELECCWCGVLEAPLPSPIGLAAIYIFFHFDVLASSWQILECLSKRDGRARRAIKQRVNAGVDVSAAKHIRQAASGCTQNGHARHTWL